jgi:hypothetical protein
MIKGVVGRGGSGKTFFTVNRLWRLFKAGRDIYSNTPLVDLRVRWYRTPNGFQWIPVDCETFGKSWASGYIKTFEDIYALDNCEVFLDELGSWMPHRSKAIAIPEEVRRFLAQDRREGVNIHWTHRTTQVFPDVLANTAEITRCQRYAMFVVGQSFDPEDRAEKVGRRNVLMVSPHVYDLYQTLARVGNGSGEGFGLGGRKAYRSSDGLIALNAFGEHSLDIFVNPRQNTVLLRMFGPEKMFNWRVEERRFEGRTLPGGLHLPGVVDRRYVDNASVHIPVPKGLWGSAEL